MRLRCPSCQVSIEGSEVEVCPGCKTLRQPSGWQKVAELVVHDRGSDEDDQPTQHGVSLSRESDPILRTVYLRAGPTRAEPTATTIRLAIVFLSAFAMTTIVVLGSWTALSLTRPERVVAPPQIQIVEVEKQVPVPVPVPVPVFTEPAPVAVAPRPRPRPSPRPSPRAAPEPLLIVEPAPVAPAPVAPVSPVAAPPPPPPEVPAAAKALGGTYAGKAGGASLVMELRFLPDGALEATIRGGSTVQATGSYKLSGDTATIMLMERGNPDPIVYSGTIGGGTVDGRMTAGGKSLGKFSANK